MPVNLEVDMTDKDNQKYGMYSLLVGLFLLIYLGSLVYLIYMVIYSFYYHFNNDALTTMQVFKLFLKRYIVSFIFYAFSSSMLKSTYKTWKELNKKRQDSEKDWVDR